MAYIHFHNLNGNHIFAQPCGEERDEVIAACRKQGFDVTAIDSIAGSHLHRGVFSYGPLVGIFLTSKVNTRDSLSPAQADAVYQQTFRFGDILEAAERFDVEEL